ncbi:MAG: 4-(cytidine 5'-diphospho)-2-C-methyl-D-erythritol kinase [Candidatus Omnitrophica bacterium]|nr:4-(cytidine 5'-diphospho)-2-C-methyl-D-erythritol kinase [Candidatus Omnitrophota bacterium]
MPTSYLSVLAPAKLNLILRISRKRKDGFHDLCSLFQRVSFCDEIRLRRRKKSGLKLSVSGLRVPVREGNTLQKAYRVLCDFLHSFPGLEVKLKKIIPIGAGLGGGSSDAASFLMAANHLFRLKLSKPDLARLGQQVGSDVPFFIYDCAEALVEGRGERVKPVACTQEYFFVIVGFSKGLSTREMYHELDAQRRQPVFLTSVRGDVRICARSLNCGQIARAQRMFVNDFKEIAKGKHVVLRRLLDTWKQEGVSGYLTGSGSSVFAVFSKKASAEQLANRLKRDPGLKVVVVSTFFQSINIRIKKGCSGENNRSPHIQERRSKK